MFHDQDVLNAVLWDKKIELPLSYNFLTFYLEKNIYNNKNPKGQEAILEASNAPCIIHFAGSLKPWSIIILESLFTEFGNHTRRNRLGLLFCLCCRKGNP